MSALERIRSTLATGGKHLGDLIWWTLADARVERAVLENVWSGAQLDLSYLPDVPSPEKALKMAARIAATGQRERLVRLGLEDEAQVIFTVVHEQRHDDGSLTYTQEARVLLDRERETASTDTPGHDLAEAILARYAEVKDTHPSDDVRRAIMNVLGACAAVTLREHGGVYWVPAPHAATIHKVQKAVENVGSSRVYLLPVHESSDSNRTLGDAAAQAITDELAAMKAEVEQFLSAPPDRASTLVRRLDSFDELRARAELYKSVLSVTVADLDQTLSSLTASVESLLNQKAAA